VSHLLSEAFLTLLAASHMVAPFEQLLSKGQQLLVSLMYTFNSYISSLRNPMLLILLIFIIGFFFLSFLLIFLLGFRLH
jgi:protein-S-isoprenylcysteine O-methyltransferase Ste14